MAKAVLPLAPAFATMMTGEAIWALAETLELMSKDVLSMEMCYDLRIAGTVAAVLGTFAFVLRYTGEVRLGSPPFVGLWRNGHRAPRPGVDRPLAPSLLQPDRHQRDRRFPVRRARVGPRLLGAHRLCVFDRGTFRVLLAQVVVFAAGVYRAQAGVMLFGVLVPTVIDLLDWTASFRLSTSIPSRCHSS